MKLIPAVDLKDGQCVRLYKGDYDRMTVYSEDPVFVARNFSALDVADLHIVDLDGARSGQQRNHAAVEAIVSLAGVAVQIGGGIRSREDIARWLAKGVARCVVGSKAIGEPGLVNEWISEFGVDSIVLALDVRLDDKGVPNLTSHGWTTQTDLSLWQCLDGYKQADNHYVLCTDVERDGALSGPNLALYAEILQRYPGLRLQASGGIRNIQDLRDLRELNVPAAISGRALLDGSISDSEVSAFRPSV